MKTMKGKEVMNFMIDWDVELDGMDWMERRWGNTTTMSGGNMPTYPPATSRNFFC